MSSFFRHINWQRLASIFSSHFSSRYGFSKGRSPGSGNSPNKATRARYADLENKNRRPGPQGYETAPVKLMRTYVRTSKTDEVGEDGIHLQYDIEQQTSPRHSQVLGT